MRYVVDPDQLRRLGAGLADVGEAVLRLHPLDAVPSPVLGSPAVAEALRAVTDNWSQARRRLVSDLAHLARATEAAAATYALVDQRSVVGADPVGAR